MKYLFLNHKMNFTKTQFLKYQEKLSKLEWKNHLNVCVFPSFTNISEVKEECSYNIGSQNVSSYPEGSYTGEVSAKQLKELNVRYSLVGHSERRNKFNETNEEIKEKIKRLEEEEIIPVLCIGEKEQEKREETLKEQLESVITEETQALIIAYEPVYSIGTGVILENKKIEEAVSLIKEYINREYNKNFPVLYGGSVDDTNIEHLNRIPNLDGFLIGKASLDVEKVKKMMEEIK